MPFRESESDGVLRLTLDTPGSPVNVFNLATARQLCGILDNLDAARTRAVVFDTAKPDSFLNGVGLMLAHATRTRDDVMSAAEIPWSAYRAIYECPVPTFAVVQGSCFGCGVEFALSCDYRIAADTSVTQFYMTEVADYLFLPLFGSTWNLPETVGLESAIDLLLWGQRWDAATAMRNGLVDEVAPASELAAVAHAFATRTAGLPVPEPAAAAWGDAEELAVARTRQRIDALPPTYQPLYEQALELLMLGAKKSGTYREHQRRELEASAHSALSANGKAAYSFFYLRQMASQRATGGARTGSAVLSVGIRDTDDGDARTLARDFVQRRVPQLQTAHWDDAALRLVSAGSAHADAAAGSGAVRVCLRAGHCDAVGLGIYAPAYHRGGRLVELAGTVSDGDEDLARELARALQRLGLEVARTTPRAGTLSDRMLAAYWRPWLAFAGGGGGAHLLNATLRAAGFVRLPSHVIDDLGGEPLASLLAARLGHGVGSADVALEALADAGFGAEQDPSLLDAFALSMVEVCAEVREAREARDQTILDLIARELLDFPRHLCSLGCWLTVDRVRSALANGPACALAGQAAAMRAARFADEGREFYR
ncbi:MAG TPA: enoyl-CoA hydratase/isomerase family protein [Candidatus Binatia bacterium]|nr:enoyl-CoA hydratase/isomerase family protein [Candidatus Binatia bacterium]